MGIPFKTGSLPEPLRKPQGSEDEVATTLAKLVSARDEKSVPALLAALMAAGFGVRDSDGSVMQTVQPGQGLVFEAWEVAAMGKMYGERKTVTLSYLSDGFKAIPALKGAPLATILLKGIRAHAQDNQSPLRFWARFIVELGRQADEPYDMLAGAEAQSVRLDAIQSALIMRRLYGDFYGFAQRSKQASAGFGGDRLRGGSTQRATADATRQRSLFVPAVLSNDAPSHLMEPRSARWAQQAQNSPCGALGRGDASTILDGAATILTTGWGELMDYLGAEKYAAFLNIANILLVYAKFIATYAALETEISVENPPLVRTTASVPGGWRQLTAKVTMNVGKWENVNCIRTALNVATGIDFALLSDGPLEGVEVNWHLNEGGDQSFSQGKNQIVGFWNGGPRIQDAGTYAGIPGQGGVPVGNATRTKTGKDGLARVYLEGRGHVPYIRPPFRPVMKQAVVRTTVRLKGGDVKGDAVDISGQALGLIFGGAAALITMPAELLYRTDWASTATLTVPVKDWESCDRDRAGWQGTITYMRVRKYEGSGEKANNRSYWKEEESYEATAQLDGGRNENGAPIARVQARASETNEHGGTGLDACYRVSRQLQEVSGSATETTTAFSVSINPRTGRYSVSPPTIMVPASGTYTVTSEVKGVCNNPYNRNVNQSSPVQNAQLDPGGPSVEGEGVIDPNNPDVLAGTKAVTVASPKGGEIQITITWSLTRCRDQ